MKFVRITSTINIEVTGGLQLDDCTNHKSPLADRMNVKPLWTKTRCLIMAGTGSYPAQIKEWNTVKALVDDGILTIGEETDEPVANGSVSPEKAEEMLASVTQGQADIDKVSTKKSKKVADINLDEIAGE